MKVANYVIDLVLSGVSLAAACVILAGCTGPALLKEPRPVESSKALAEGRDERILASIEAVILRNGPGAWARDAEWDEYLIRIRALSDEDVEIRGIAIFDALENRVEPCQDGRQLVDGTREIHARYVKSGKQEEGPAVPPLRQFGGLPASPVSAIPVLVDAVIGGTTYWQVNREIQRRRTTLPVHLPGRAETNIDLFFPRTPLSERAEFVYVDRHGEHRLHIDTRGVLAARRAWAPISSSRP
jgi:hypothetical protein